MDRFFFLDARRFWKGLSPIVAATVLAVAGCEEKVPPKAPPPQVQVAAARLMDMPLEIRTIGTVEPIQSVTLRAQVGGYLGEIFFGEGQEVTAGQRLFQLDPRTYNAQQKVSEGALEQTRAQLANAEYQLRHGENLFKQQFISEETLENLRAAARSLKATVQAQAAALERAQLDRQFTLISAPFTGRMGRWLAFKGDLVQANQTQLATLNQMRPIDVRISIPEKDLPTVRRAMASGETPVRAAQAEAGAEPANGTLNFVDNAVDEHTGSIVVKARFDNEDERLWPGQFVDVTIQVGVREGATVVPAVALQTGQLGEYVWVIDGENKALNRPVKTGPTRGGITIINEGLRPGEKVVVDGHVRVAPGIAVRIEKEVTFGDGAS